MPISLKRLNRSLQIGAIALLASGLAMGGRSAQAQESTLPVIRVPVEVQTLLDQARVQNDGRPPQPSQQRLTIPSVWWIDRQFGEKLVLDWGAFAAPEPQLQVQVRSNLWARFDFFERYAFVHHFGSFSRSHGYQLLVVDRANYPLAAYLCQFETVTPAIAPPIAERQGEPPVLSEEQLADLPCKLWMNPIYPRVGI
jgi:hypothetical protein